MLENYNENTDALLGQPILKAAAARILGEIHKLFENPREAAGRSSAPTHNDIRDLGIKAETKGKCPLRGRHRPPQLPGKEWSESWN